MRKAETAVDKGEDDLARAALDRYQTSQRLALSYREQVDDQKLQVETLKGALVKLEQKLDEARSKRDLLIARHRRGIALGKAARAQTAMGDNSKRVAFDRLKDRARSSSVPQFAGLTRPANWRSPSMTDRIPPLPQSCSTCLTVTMPKPHFF